MNMEYCPNCGTKLNGTVNFCPNCGFKLSDVQYTAAETEGSASSAAAQDAVMENVSDTLQEGDQKPIYDVVLVRLENCSKETCMDLLEGLMGYEKDLAEKVIDDCPSLIGTSLTRAQAVTIAQAFSEYGADMTIYSPDGAVDFEGKEPDPQASGTSYQNSGEGYAGQTAYTGNGYTGSIFKEDGSLIGTAAAVMASLAAVNLISGTSKWNRPGVYDNIFQPGLSTRPPAHGRRPADAHRLPRQDPFRPGGRRDSDGRHRPDGPRRPGGPGDPRRR